MFELILAILCILLSIALRMWGEFPLVDLGCMGLGIVFLIIYLNTDIPTAKEVYQGKTTLEITYKDGIPIDTVVVYKEK